MFSLKYILVLLCAVCLLFCKPHSSQDCFILIDKGEFSKAREVIEKELAAGTDLEKDKRDKMLFAIERMERIKKDFKKTEQEVMEYIKEYIPEVTAADLRRWEKERSLEFMVIDGERKYFNRAARNLFRINKECIKIWQQAHNESSENKFDLDGHIYSIIEETSKSGLVYAKPVRMKIKYTITVPEGAVPENETIRCWIPFPREIEKRQTNIKILSTNPEKYSLAPNENLQRTIYFEQQAVKDNPAKFEVEYIYSSQGMYVHIDPEKVVKADPSCALADFLKEEPPHIVFSDSLKELSKRIVGEEKNPYRIAQILFEWVDTNIPWASAREYSTISNLSWYPYLNKHGDCGIQTMLFITLCRMNGIPARWQSGWEFQPPKDSMHDWGMIYFGPYGWMPMDVTYGMRDTDSDDLKWFYVNGMDSYRLIFNDDVSKEFTPAKKHFRSETVDSQRGEVEWDGGNLYFDQWTWNMDWEELPVK